MRKNNSDMSKASIEDRKIFDAANGVAEYDKCVEISTQASIREMVAPGLLAIIVPVLIGFIGSAEMLGGLLAGVTTCGVLMAIFQSNAGGAWDNAKKMIEEQGKKGTESHKAAVVGDTVGDPFKDTSGPSLNILLKLMSVVALVIAPSIAMNGESGIVSTQNMSTADAQITVAMDTEMASFDINHASFDLKDGRHMQSLLVEMSIVNTESKSRLTRGDLALEAKNLQASGDGTFSGNGMVIFGKSGKRPATITLKMKDGVILGGEVRLMKSNASEMKVAKQK